MSAMQNQTNGNESDFRLTRIWARNFKSIRELDLKIGPLTVLVGSNASGKSNVLDVLRFIKGALDRDVDSAVASRQGIVAVRRFSPGGGTRDVEIGFEVERGEFRMQYGFVLGSRAGVYRVKRERGKFILRGDRDVTKEFEIREGRITKPKKLNYAPFETSELAFPKLVHLLFPIRINEVEAPRESEIAFGDVIGAVVLIGEMQFYRLFPDAIREPRKPLNERVLLEDGSNLASVLRAMVKRKSRMLEEINGNLGQVVPGFKDLVVQQSGGYLVVKMRHGVGQNGSRVATFDLTQESDGTVRLLGLLTAFYQEGPVSLIGLEEPELMVHPGALAVLADVMVEASTRTQVVATTHSPDLIDRLPIESLRAVEMRDGCTEVGPVSETQSKAVMNGLFTSGELHSMEGLVPRS